MKKYQGFILITVILFILLASLMEIYAMQDICIELRMSEAMRTFYQLDNRMPKVIASVENQWQQCIYPVMRQDTLMHYPLTWWQRYACSGRESGVTYYYIVESLGVDACAMSAISQQPIHYWRMTMQMLSKQGDGKIEKQAIFYEPEITIVPCQGKKRMVAVGLQSIVSI